MAFPFYRFKLIYYYLQQNRYHDFLLFYFLLYKLNINNWILSIEMK
jgi:hypothetical protein